MLQAISKSFIASETLNIGSQQARYIRCTTGNATFTLSAFNGSTQLVFAKTFMAGLSVGPLPDYADTIRIENGSTAQTIEIYFGDTDTQDNRLVGTVNITGGLASKNYVGGDTNVSKGAVSLTNSVATQIWAATLTPGFGLIYNPDTTNTIYLGVDNTVTASTGIPLGPGAITDAWPAGVDCYGFQSSGGALNVRKIQNKWA